jgi:hypothetical protein
MLEKIEDAETPLKLQEIEQVEKKLNIVLPLAYKNFLLKYNGGRPEPAGFDIVWLEDRINSETRRECSEDWRSSMVDWFLSIYEGEYSNFMEYNLVDFEGRIPRETVAIAHDPGGNLVLLGVAGEQTGKVLFWVKDYENWEGDDSVENIPWYDNIGLIANSFDEFINEKLRD